MKHSTSIGKFSMKILACLGFLLNVVLFGTYYAVTKEAIDRIDPLIFTYFEMMTLVPVALGILLLNWHAITRAVIQRGILVGSVLCLALFTISIALKYTTATGTAFFPALNGLLAALFAWLFLRQPVGKATWLAGLLSLIGTILLLLNSPMGGPRGALIAFLGGLFFTGYVFLSDHEPRADLPPWPIFGVELLTMAVWANLVVLLFGDWHAVHPQLPKDLLVILYVAGACTFLPTLITTLFQKHISPVTVSFIYILEPILGAIFAFIYLRETIPFNGYIGGSLVVVGACIQTWSSISQSATKRAATFPHLGLVRVGLLALLTTVATYTLSMLGGFPPLAWRMLYTLGPSLLNTMQKQNITSQLLSVVPAGTHTSLLWLLIQASCWLLAWIGVLILAGKTLSSLQALRNAQQQAIYQPHPETAARNMPVRLALDTYTLRHVGAMPQIPTTPPPDLRAIQQREVWERLHTRPTPRRSGNHATWGAESTQQNRTVRYEEHPQEIPPRMQEPAVQKRRRTQHYQRLTHIEMNRVECLEGDGL